MVKEYSIELRYKDYLFIVRLCDTSYTKSAKRLDCTEAYFREYCSWEKAKDPFPEIYARPFSKESKALVGTKEILWEEARKAIDKAEIRSKLTKQKRG